MGDCVCLLHAAWKHTQKMSLDACRPNQLLLRTLPFIESKNNQTKSKREWLSAPPSECALEGGETALLLNRQTRHAVQRSKMSHNQASTSWLFMDLMMFLLIKLHELSQGFFDHLFGVSTPPPSKIKQMWRGMTLPPLASSWSQLVAIG